MRDEVKGKHIFSSYPGSLLVPVSPRKRHVYQ